MGLGTRLGSRVEELKLGGRAVRGSRPASDLGVGVGVYGVPVKDLAGGGVELRARAVPLMLG